MRDDYWRKLRHLRYDPPGSAISPSGAGKAEINRADLFNAALEQAEQFCRSAESVGPQVKPILIFYGLSQAARAIYAAANKVTDEHARLRKHGIAVDISRLESLGSLTVSPRPGSFSKVADVLGSSNLAGDVRIFDLWSVLPEMRDFFLHLPSGSVPLSDYVVPLQIEEVHAGERAGVDVYKIPLASVGGRFSIVDESGDTINFGSGGHVSLKKIEALFSRYPGFNGCEIARRPDSVGIRGSSFPGYLNLPVSWEIPKGSNSKQVIRSRSTWYRGQRLVFPSLGESENPVHPLMIWWAILFALSMIARYEPEGWASILDVSSSRDAVPVEAFLDYALDVLPETIFDAICQVALE